MEAKEMAVLADAYWLTYQKRLAADKVAAALKVEESKLVAQILATLRSDEITSIGGQLVQLSIDKEPEYVPTISDYSKFCEFVLSSKDLSLLERRVSKSAVKERWDLGADVPGIIKFPVFKLHRHKL
jgi:hypothetical protein